MSSQDSFGSYWTEDKLNRIRKYLRAYSTIMSQQPFRYAYVDAFAGTGYRRQQTEEHSEQFLFPDLISDESQGFIEGSARIALQIEPPFNKYVFIEQDPTAFSKLVEIKKDFPEKEIDLINGDANEWLQMACAVRGAFWRENRAVVFLDPYGMQVEWKTLETIADTQAIDVWILFPLGIAVNRLLKRDGNINEGWRARLDAVFGTTEWFDVFYESHKNLLGEEHTEKIVSLENIGRYYNDRLKSIFAGVAENPLPLYNSTNNPLYLLCFAASNEKGAPVALRIAQYILDN